MCERAEEEAEWVKRSQEVFFKVRQLMLRLRAHTLAYDELSMCCARHKLYGQLQNVNAMRAGLFVHADTVCTSRCAMYRSLVLFCMAFAFFSK